MALNSHHHWHCWPTEQVLLWVMSSCKYCRCSTNTKPLAKLPPLPKRRCPNAVAWTPLPERRSREARRRRASMLVYIKPASQFCIVMIAIIIWYTVYMYIHLYSSAGGPYPSAAFAGGYQPAPTNSNRCTVIVRMYIHTFKHTKCTLMNSWPIHSWMGKVKLWCH